MAVNVIYRDRTFTVFLKQVAHCMEDLCTKICSRYESRQDVLFVRETVLPDVTYKFLPPNLSTVPQTFCSPEV